MKLLIITHSFAPDLNPRAFRWTAVADELARRGHAVHVLCAAQGDGGPTDAAFETYRIVDPLRKAAARASAPAAVPGRRPSRLRQPLTALARRLWRGLQWPDYACAWIGPATRAARQLCRVNDYDWVISVSHPFSGHVVALRARHCAARARWMVDIGDPFHLMRDPSPNNRRLYGWLSHQVEARVLAVADAITVTTEPTRQAYLRHFAIGPENVCVIAPLLSLPPDPTPSPAAADGTVRMVFVGTLYRNLRSPRFLLECHAALRAALLPLRLELHFYGATNDCGDELRAACRRAEDAIVVHGLVGRAAAHQAMVDADVLVNIGNRSETQLASKVVEYMAMGKPILNLTGLAADPSVDALADYPAALTVHHGDDPPDAVALMTIRAFIENLPAVPSCTKAEIRRKNSAERIGSQYAALLERPERGAAQAPR